MRKLSLKLKLTLLYSFFMVLVTCIALMILFSLSNREILASAQADLKARVQESTDDIEVRGGEIELDSDFYSLDHNVYLSIYDREGAFLYGKRPAGIAGLETFPDFTDGGLHTVKGNDSEWYFYDIFYVIDGQQMYIRGITSVADAEADFRITLRFAGILLPMVVVLTAVVGYRFTRRTLLPVRRITETVQEIQRDGDLSRRIGLTEGRESKKESRDEIYVLAHTFDGMLKQLDQAFQRERQFTSDVSHELRTPVSVMLAQCDACLADEALTVQQREQIGLLKRKAGEMAQMISHLLLLSRADQGRQQLQKEELNLSELTEMIVEEQKLLAQVKGIELSGEIQQELMLEVDETFYIRMLVNLISNAVQYGKENGHVWVKLRRTDAGVEGVVEDDGIGISEKELPYIWERFYRADPSRTGKEDGGHSGLGLSMVKWIVQAHSGKIRAESVPGKGSRFIFLFPWQQEND